MWLVLCDPSDHAALWAAQGLKALRLEPVEVVSAGALACALGWEHRISASGVTLEISLTDGRVLRGHDLHGVLNRLSWLPTDHLARATPGDRDYAMQELLALLVSALHGISAPVLNRPVPPALSGFSASMCEWVSLAAQAGWATTGYLEASNGQAAGRTGGGLEPVRPPQRTVFVVGGEVVGAVPPPVAAAALRLAELVGTDLLGIQFGLTEGRPWTFASATSHPDLRVGGRALLTALARALMAGRNGR